MRNSDVGQLRRRAFSWWSFCLVILGLVAVCWPAYVVREQREMLDATRSWARVNALPESATQVVVKKSGSIFTREFNVSFQAPMEDIIAWLDASPGTSVVAARHESVEEYDELDSELDPELDSDQRGASSLGESGVWKFIIAPGGGAQYAAVWVDVDTGFVRIRTFWS